MVFLPLVGAILQAFMPSSLRTSSSSLGRWVALTASLLASIFGVAVVFLMKREISDLQMVETLPWIGSYAITYEMGVDGLNALLVLLVSIIFPVLITSEWDQKFGLRGMHSLFLILQCSFMGAVCAQDLFLQFFFWALSAFPFYFLISIWGGEKREIAAFRSIVSASFGNSLIFAALILIYYSVEPHTFSLGELAGGKLNGKVFDFMGHTLSVPLVAFSLMSIGLAFRAPIWPFHGWFTRVAKEAPPSVLVLFTAVNVPVASYLFSRLVYSLFPEALQIAAPYIVIVGTMNLIIGIVCAVAQKGLRTLLAFLCLSQIGLVLVGMGSLSPAGVVGAVYQQMALGLALAGFGLMSGLIISRAGKSAFVNDQGQSVLGGIALQAPVVGIVGGIVIASILGFPGLGGFVGSSLVMIGSYSVRPILVILSGFALILAAYCLFTAYRYIFLGTSALGVGEKFDDLSFRERAYLFPLVLGLIIFGIYPKPFLDLVKPTVLTLLSTVK